MLWSWASSCAGGGDGASAACVGIRRGLVDRAAPAQRRRLDVHRRTLVDIAQVPVPAGVPAAGIPRLTGGYLLAVGSAALDHALRRAAGHLAAGLSDVVRAGVHRAGARRVGRAPVVACQPDAGGAWSDSSDFFQPRSPRWCSSCGPGWKSRIWCRPGVLARWAAEELLRSGAGSGAGRSSCYERRWWSAHEPVTG